MIQLKKPEEIELIKKSAQVLGKAHGEVAKRIKPGVKTRELDKIAETVIRDHGAIPAFLGYPGPTPYPATINSCVNEEMVHAIPGKRELKPGDLVSIDCGTVYKEFVADSAFSAGVEEVSSQVQTLMDVTKQSLEIGISKMVSGNRVGDVSAAIQKYVESFGFHVPREYTGHGVGRSMHEGPQVPNWGLPGRGMVLRPGMTIAIEPMVLVGTHRTKIQPDQWTVSAYDGSLTAHWEHSIAVNKNGPLILTNL